MEEDHCHWCQLRKFSSHERAPIYIINKVDNETLPKNFRFIENSILLPGVSLSDDGFRIGCECEEDGECKRAGCGCLSDMNVEDSDADKKVYVYHSFGPNRGCLRSSNLDSRAPIYECHSQCGCTEQCPNKVVDRGRRIPLQIFRTEDGRGWGVRSTVDIKVGQFVDRYLGEIMTAYQANFRRKKSHIAQRKDVYLFALDKFSDPDSQDPRLAGDPYEVDGEFKSGPTRFINHSCEPNLRIFARVGAHADRHIHDLAFFAIEEIPAGTELTFDYVDGSSDTAVDIRDHRKRKDMTKCLCGTRSCRGYIW